jgi:phosphatidate cytidylyltransferase
LAQDRAESAAAGRWRDLRARAITACIAAPVGLGALWLGGVAWQLLVMLALLGMAGEWRNIGRALKLPYAAMLLCGLIYLMPACVALVWLRKTPGVGLGNVLFVLLIVWASDIGAYMVGRLVGGPKLAPSISPGKTRSGAVGGLVSAMLIGLIAAEITQGGEALRAMLEAGLLGIAAQAGDLLESAIKRRAGVKDSGWVLPGHGGLLDRLDALLTAAPLAALMALATGPGVYLWVGTPLR